MKALSLPYRKWQAAALVALGLLLAMAPSLGAQTPKSPRYKNAMTRICPHSSVDMYPIEQFYALGQFDSIASRRDCLDDLFELTRPGLQPSVELQSVAERFMYLYALCQVELHHQEAAEEAVTKLLQRFPKHKFQVDEDPPQMQLLLDSLVPYDGHHFGAYVGMNLGIFNGSQPQTVRDDITPGGAVVMGPDFSKLPRFCAGVEWQYHLAYRHSLITGLGLQTISFRTFYASSSTKGNAHAVGDWQLKEDDNHTYLQLPLSYEYRVPIWEHDRRRKSWLGISAGLYGGFLLQGVSELHTTRWLPDPNGGSEPVQSIQDFTLGNLRSRRNILTGGATGGISWVSQLGLVDFYLRLGGQLSFRRLRDPGTTLSRDFVGYVWSYHIGDQGDFRLHCINLTAGVLLPRANHVKNLHRP